MGIVSLSISVKGGEVRAVYKPLTDIKQKVTPLHTKNKAVTDNGFIEVEQVMLSKLKTW